MESESGTEPLASTDTQQERRTETPTSLYKGSCLCGSISFATSGFSPLAANCHCIMCRKFHGAAFSTFGSFDKLTWLSGQTLLKDYRGKNGSVRTFCSECGSSLGYRSECQGVDEMEIALSAFDDDIPIVPDAHIYTDYKANWHTPSNDLPMCKEGREP